MTQEQTQACALAQAVRAAGGQGKLALQLGVTQQAVSKWLAQGWAPAARAVEIEMHTGVPRAHLLKPSLRSLVSDD